MYRKYWDFYQLCKHVSKCTFIWLTLISDWQTGQGTFSSLGMISSWLSSKEIISTFFFRVSSVLINDVGWEDGGIFSIFNTGPPPSRRDGTSGFDAGPPPSRRPWPLNGMNDVLDEGLATTPPCVGLASLDSSVSVDLTDGAFTVTVELPLFIIPPNPVTVFPLAELPDDELKYPDIGFRLVVPLFLPTMSLDGVLILTVGWDEVSPDVDLLPEVITARLVEGPAVGLVRNPRISRVLDGISTLVFLDSVNEWRFYSPKKVVYVLMSLPGPALFSLSCFFFFTP